MSSPGELVHAKLAAAAGVTALVSTKIFPNLAPQGTPAPFIVFQVVSDVPENVLAPDANQRLTNARVQVDCYAKTYAEVRAIAAAVDAALAGDLTVDPSFAAWRELSRDLYDDESRLHRVWSDFSTWS